MDIEGMPLALLVNPLRPAARRLKLLPAVEQALDARRAVFRVQRTKGLEHGVEQALRAIEAGELPVVMSGDGLVGAIGGAMAGAETPLGIIPGGRGNDLARVLGIPERPRGGGRDPVLRPQPPDRRRRGQRQALPRHRQRRLRLRRQPARQRNPVLRGNLVYAYAALRTLLSWKPARFTVRVDEERIRFSGYSVSVANSKAYGGGMYIAPDAELDDGEFDIVAIGEVGKLRFLGNLPKVFKGTHVEEDEVRVFRAPHLELSASRPSPSTPTAST